MIEGDCGVLTEIKNILKNSHGCIEPRIIIVSGLLSIYLTIVAYMSIWDTLRNIFFLPILFVIFYFTMLAVSQRLRYIQFPINNETTSNSDLKFFTALFLIVFLGQLLYWLAYYPGGFNLDAYGQWDQVHGLMKLNNWHPVFTTGCYWLLTRICDSFAFCIFTQLFAFSLSVAYLLLNLAYLKISKVLLLITSTYIALNPAIGMNNVCLFKDVPFTIALIWMTVIIIRVVVTKGEWLKSTLHLVCLILELVIISLIRHNGIFITIPVIICMAFVFQHYMKRVLMVAITYLLLFAAIQGPVFSVFSVKQHSNFTGESVGIPMSIMVNNFVEDCDNTPSEVKELLLSIADANEWKDKYILGEWDSCKWDFGGIELFEGKPLSEFFRLAWLSACASPDYAYQSIRENTRVVWQVLGFAEWNTWVYIEENDYGISENPNIICASIADEILEFSLTLSGTFLFWNIGVPNVILVLLILVVITRKKYEKLLYILPFLTYNMLTMMLLCGPSHRYFYFNSVLFLPVILLVLRESNSLTKPS